MFPRFGGTPTAVNGATTEGSATIPVASSLTGIQIGQVITGPNVPDGTTIAAINTVTPASITLSAPATADGTQLTFNVYTCPLIPLTPLTVYINLASCSIQKGRWLGMWKLGMHNYVAHFCQLYLQSEGSASSALGAAALAGLEKGITVSKSVDSVSTSSQLLQGLEEWGALAKTSYGTQLISLAKAGPARGPIFVW
jgi:hypothetical protein